MDAVLAGDSHPVDPGDRRARRLQRDDADRVRSAADAAIDQLGQVVADCVKGVRGRAESRNRSVDVPAAVIR